MSSKELRQEYRPDEKKNALIINCKKSNLMLSLNASNNDKTALRKDRPLHMV